WAGPNKPGSATALCSPSRKVGANSFRHSASSAGTSASATSFGLNAHLSARSAKRRHHGRKGKLRWGPSLIRASMSDSVAKSPDNVNSDSNRDRRGQGPGGSGGAPPGRRSKEIGQPIGEARLCRRGGTQAWE